MRIFCCPTSLNDDKQKTQEIDKQLHQERERKNNEVKLLLLGTGECGKSTILKQMTIIHSTGFSETERKMYTDTIHQNILDSIRAILSAMLELNISFSNPLMDKEMKAVEEMYSLVMFGDFPHELATSISSLWQDEGVINCFKRSSEYQLNDSAAYFLSNVERICARNYIPSLNDILLSRTKTTGIVETNFTFKKVQFKIFDVGGQRSERRKWVHCFEGVTAILFIVALSEYDQKLAEDNITNRMHESMRLFESISNNKWFTNTSIILFFNKIDIFEVKIKNKPFALCFHDYDGNNSFDSVSKFVLEKFENLSQCKNKRIYPHFTCATDTDNIKLVFDSVTDVVIKNNLKDSGLF